MSVVFIFSAALFVSALLLFLVQPMFAKMVLPLLGGSPSVWTTCVLFFQAGLLAGYGYAHLITTRLSMRWQAVVHAAVVVVPLTILPFALPASTSERQVASSQPAFWLLSVLATTVGLPFFALSATAPLLQRWFSAVRHAFAGDPYFLYAASNAGSLTALLVYPTLVEPLLTLRAQRTTWAFGYLLGGGLVLSCAVVAWRATRLSTATEEEPTPSEPISAAHRLQWLFLSLVPSGLMLAVTTFMSTDVAVVPMFWVVPLGLYLLTFIIAFGGSAEWLWPVVRRMFPLVLLPLVLFMLVGGGGLLVMLPLHLLTFAVIALLLHGELARSRPAIAHLTEFYFWISLGGVLGGVLNSIVAPLLFTSAAEYPLLLVAACVAMARYEDFVRMLRRPRLLVRPAAAAAIALAVLIVGDALQLDSRQIFALLGIAVVVCFSVSRDPARFASAVALLMAVGGVHTARVWGQVLEADRTFFGIYRVSEDQQRGLVTLFHGTTVHGRQALGSSAPEPLTYYHRQSPIGRVFSTQGERLPLSVGVVGLGVGSLAAYAAGGDQWTFYEIDPAVERIARDHKYFRFLEKCGGACQVTIGDARLSLERSPATHDIIILDAFSSDAIPLHLLTLEAVRVYLSRLRAHGFLAFHISNRHVNLRPALARIARDHSLTALAQTDVRAADNPQGYASSVWMLMAPDPSAFARLPQDQQWTPVVADTRPSWTDDFSNIWTVLRWRDGR
jgi:hypothetical protein